MLTMADKEATVYIVDVGASMGERHHGRSETDLDWALRYVWDKITSTVATGRKTATLGVVGLRTDDTTNELDSEEGYAHISVIQPISQILMPDLRSLRSALVPSSTNSGDAISALVIAIQMISTYCKKLKYRRKIILLTDARGSMETEDIDEITKKINEDNIELVILGVDFDDPEYGVKEEDKDPRKAQNEETLKSLTETCDGVFGTLQQAVDELGIPRIKSVRPVPSYKGQLTLGDPEKYDSAMSIDVERYPRTMVAKPPSASQFVTASNPADGDASIQSSATMAGSSDLGPSAGQAALTSVRNARTYQIEDSEAPGGKRDVDRDDLAKGYEYGRTAVHISETDENITKLETMASFDIIGFVPKDKYERYMHMSTTCIVIAQRTNDKAQMALSSLIHALWELESYAVARLVTKDDKSPLIVLLAPSIEADYECLLDVQLPFAEDVRSYRFPPLDRVQTVSGKVLTEHRNIPTRELQDAMDTYVDSMDLSTFGRDDEGNPAEFMPIEDTFSPVLHRIDQCVRWRAVHPAEPIPPPYEILTRFSRPPDDLVEQASDPLRDLIKIADVKKVSPRQKGRKRARDRTKPLSGLDVDELLGREKRTKISPENAVPEFKQMLETTEDLGAIQDASKQMSVIIENLIRHSVGDSGYGRAIEALNAMREELTALEEPTLYNDFVRSLKNKLLKGDLGGDRRDMWWEIRRNRVGLVDKKLSSRSEVSEEEAAQFYTSR
ncbi:ATP-dependent DNA helicase II subunit 2 [Xylona heveae TC161]|uniref:ATP-dependent DNA helicase II subunit 2 n=1 Tax=Xylona heveae (strain CBS 132557 / TC161) TaxID=1328760 RepID=A0A165HZY1_XYLHT|nr:ATP-dependent DNA helicase II subunit 2 [Xylona heveae TC161]KZF24158.1 ATP-dependent DNA helicase II subunit 2 [Xylona heveae TC161]